MNTSYIKKTTLVLAALLIGFVAAYVMPAQAAEPNAPPARNNRQAGHDFLKELSEKLKDEFKNRFYDGRSTWGIVEEVLYKPGQVCRI